MSRNTGICLKRLIGQKLHNTTILQSSQGKIFDRPRKYKSNIWIDAPVSGEQEYIIRIDFRAYYAKIVCIKRYPKICNLSNNCSFRINLLTLYLHEGIFFKADFFMVTITN